MKHTFSPAFALRTSSSITPSLAIYQTFPWHLSRGTDGLSKLKLKIWPSSFMLRNIPSATAQFRTPDSAETMQDGRKTIWQNCPVALTGRGQVTPDGHKACQPAVEDAFGMDCEYPGSNIYEAPDDGDRRYSPAVCIGCDLKVVSGKPDLKHGNASYVERQNLTITPPQTECCIHCRAEGCRFVCKAGEQEGDLHRFRVKGGLRRHAKRTAEEGQAKIVRSRTLIQRP